MDPYVVDAEDVAKIKSELIGHPKADALCPLVKSVTKAVASVKTVATDALLSDVAGKYVERAEKNLHKARLQIGVSAICVGIYITRQGTAKPLTKLNSLKSAKSLLNALNIAQQLPLTLMNRLYVVIKALEEDVKHEKIQKK